MEDWERVVNANSKFVASVVTLGILSVIGIAVGKADPAEQPGPGCVAPTREQAKLLGDELYRQGSYQRAGECYQAAGDLADANEAFVKAVQPNSDVTAKDLAHQGQVAKTLFTGVQQAFRSNH
jgi:hypothetical protein